MTRSRDCRWRLLMNSYESYKESQIDWVGQIPSHWEIAKPKYKLKRVTRPIDDEDEVVTCFRDGVVTLRKNRREDGFTTSIKEHGYQQIKPGDLVVHEMDGFAGAIGISDSKGKATPVYTVIEPDHRVDLSFITYLLREMSKTGKIESLARSIRERTTDFRWNMWSVIHFPFPPIEEQKLISLFLNKKAEQINMLIEKIQKKIDLLKEQRISLINQFVTKGLDPDVEMKDSGVEWIGQIPKHYNLQKIKFLFVEKKSKQNSELSSGSISFGQVVYKDDESILKSTKESYQEVLEGEFLINPLNLNYDLKSLRIAKSKINVVVSQGYIVLQILEGQDPDYIEYLLRKFDVIHMKSMGQGIRQTISFKNLKNELLVVPPLEEQKNIVYELNKRTEEIDRLCKLEEKRILLMKEHLHSLISSVVTGKVQVTEDMI